MWTQREREIEREKSTEKERKKERKKEKKISWEESNMYCQQYFG